MRAYFLFYSLLSPVSGRTPTFTSDPIAFVFVGGESRQTRVLQNTLNPIWGDTDGDAGTGGYFVFEEEDIDQADEIIIQIKDDDKEDILKKCEEFDIDPNGKSLQYLHNILKVAKRCYRLGVDFREDGGTTKIFITAISFHFSIVIFDLKFK